MEYASVETYVFFESFHNIPGWFQSGMIFMSEKIFLPKLESK